VDPARHARCQLQLDESGQGEKADAIDDDPRLLGIRESDRLRLVIPREVIGDQELDPDAGIGITKFLLSENGGA
jgi:hypothetical protein